MKKELLIASALVGTVGVAGVAEAASATFSGHTRNGVLTKDTDAAADGTWAGSQQAAFSVSISETTDAGVKIATGIGLSDEGAGTGSDNNPSGLTLTFTDGSKLDVIEAGNAYATHLASVPGASGEQGVGGVTANSAPTGLTWANKSASTGFEWHSAADAMGVEGLKVGLSASMGDDGDATSTSSVEAAYSIGASYVTDAGDTTITIGGGFVQADDSNNTTLNDASDSWAVAATAVTGDLTIGLGIGGGSEVESNSTVDTTWEVDGAEVYTAGLKYVSGDITLAIGLADGEAKDGVSGAEGALTDSYTSAAASVSYAVAGGVTAVVGYSDIQRDQEGSAATGSSGNSWYVGATVSF